MENSEIRLHNLHLQFEGFNYSVGLIALAAAKSGIRVRIRLKEPIKEKFQPELSHFYPTSVSQTAKAIRDFQFLMKCSSLFPHLFFPKRMLVFQPGGKLNTTFNTTVDQLLGRERERASLVVKANKSNYYQSIAEVYEQGSLVVEYQFDRNRAEMELLKMCVENGAILLDEQTTVQSKFQFNCISYRSEDITIEIPEEFPFPNPICIKTADLELILHSVFTHTSLQISISNVSLGKDSFLNEVKTILKNLNLPVTPLFDLQLENIFSNKMKNRVQAGGEITDSELKSQRFYLNQLKKSISAQLGIQINFKKLFENYPDQSITGETFRIIQTECDEKFDLAKQTGIDYKRFVYLFYRYRHQVDEMIDAAYERMNDERNPLLIWEKVEQDYLKSEWIALNRSSF